MKSAVENDVRLIATPFRLIRNFIFASLAILFAPAILVILIVASHLQPQDCGIAKVLVGIFAPIIFAVWFAGVVRWAERNNPEYPTLGEGRVRAAGLAAYFCGLGYIGVLLSVMNSLTGLESLWAMVAGLFSPAIFYALGRLFGMWLTATLAILEIGMTAFVFGRGFGFF